MLGTNARGGLGITRDVPESHPHYPGLYAMEARLLLGLGVGAQDGRGGVSYDRARYAITYRGVDYDIFEDGVDEWNRFTSKYRTFSIETLPLPGSTFKYVDGSNPVMPIPETPGKLFPSQEITYVWRRVPGIPDSGIDECNGKVNEDTFDGYPEETLLLAGVEPRPYISSTRQPLYDISFKFLYRKTTWNKIYQQSENDFTLVTTTGLETGQKIYGSADFTQLFNL